MFDRIESGLWWDRAWTLVKGCTPVSPACDHCWLASETHMRASNPNVKIQTDNAGLYTGGHFSGTVRLMEKNLDLPRRVRRPTAWAIWSDLFHEQVPDDFISDAIDVMIDCKQHVFIILTKRPLRMKVFFDMRPYSEESISNIIFGTTVEDQARADERIPFLVQVPGNKMLSIEPMLGPINLFDSVPAVFGTLRHPPYVGRIHWVICGGESGKQARPVHPDWVRSIRDQCQAVDVPFFFKQWGEWTPLTLADAAPIHVRSKVHRFGDCDVFRVGKKAAGRRLEGEEYLELHRLVDVSRRPAFRL